MYQRSWRRGKTEKERENIFVEGELLFLGRREKKERKRKEDIWRRKISFRWRRRKTPKEKEEYVWRKKLVVTSMTTNRPIGRI